MAHCFPRGFISSAQAMFRALWSLPKEEHHGREAESRARDLVGIWGSSQYDLQEAPTDATLRVNLGAWRPGGWSPNLAEAMTKDRL